MSEIAVIALVVLLILGILGAIAVFRGMPFSAEIAAGKNKFAIKFGNDTENIPPNHPPS